MLEILDQIDEVKKYDSRASLRPLAAVDLMVVHRIDKVLSGVNIHGAADLAAWFAQHLNA